MKNSGLEQGDLYGGATIFNQTICNFEGRISFIL